MRIAIYSPSLNSDQASWQEAEWFCYETLKRIAASHTDHEFIVISDLPAGKSIFEAKNIHQLSLNSASKNLLSLYRRINWKLPALLKKQQADILVSLNGFLPLRKSIPACLVIQDLSFVAERAYFIDLHSRYQRRYFPKMLSKANTIAAISNFCKQELISHFQVVEQKINVVHKGVDESFKPMGWEEREEVKNEYTDGREFFIYTGSIHPGKNIIGLLKAFSVVKKKLFSNMALVLAGPLERGYKEFPELLRTYHFRKDVKWLQQAGRTETARLTGAAYALICPSSLECFSASALEALACQTPVLAAKNPAFEETGGEAALYFNPFQPEDMGEKMCEIYKNEDLRAQLMAKADEQVAKFNWDTTAGKLWSCIEESISVKA